MRRDQQQSTEHVLTLWAAVESLTAALEHGQATWRTRWAAHRDRVRAQNAWDMRVQDVDMFHHRLSLDYPMRGDDRPVHRVDSRKHPKSVRLGASETFQQPLGGNK